MDIAILYWIQANLTSPAMDTVMQVLTMLGDNGALWIVLGLLMITMKRHREYGILLLIALAAAFLIGEFGIKPLVARPRPFVVDPSFLPLLIADPGGTSFPSSHAATAFAALTVLCFSKVNWPWKVGFGFLAFLIAFSRLYLCVHFPTDVLAGMILGIIVGVITVFLGRRWYADKAVKEKAIAKKS